MSPDEVLDIARKGAALGCKEALITLGDKPEDRWPEAREWLDAHGYDDTLAYVRAISIRILEETGLLPHLNPGVMSWTDFQRLKPVAPSMGMMLETTATRLWSEPGGPHHGSPDKEPAVRLRVLEDAGRSSVPFTSGVLIGIGETYEERAESLFALRKVTRAYHGVQELIIQNFRAKPDTAMRGMPDAELDELVATVAVARLLMGPSGCIQAPPNLVDDEYERLIGAGIDDWGGVSPLTIDHVNPERPWPQIEQLAEKSRAAGFELRERLCVYPEFVRRGEPWLDPRLRPHVAALADPETGLARSEALPQGLPWQEPEEVFMASGRTDLHTSIDTEGRTSDRRDDFDEVYGDWGALREAAAPGMVTAAHRHRRTRGPAHGRRRPHEAHRRRGAGPAARGRPGAGRPRARSPTTCASRRSETTSPTSSPATSTSPTSATPAAASAPSPSAARTPTPTPSPWTRSPTGPQQAWDVGAVEVCMQGGIHPDLPGTAYFDIARAVKERVPGMHVHAFSPMEVVNGASRTGMSDPRVADRRQGGGPGHHPGHGRGDPRRRGPLDPDQGQAARGRLDRGRRARPTSWASARPRR